MYIMDSDITKFISKSSTLHNHIVLAKIVEHIYTEISDIPQVVVLKHSLDLVLRICILLENLCYENNIKGQEKGYKKQLAIQVFQRMGWGDKESLDFLTNAIQYLHASGSIKKVKWVKKVVGKVASFFQSGQK